MTSLSRIEMNQKDILRRVALLEAPGAIERESDIIEEPFSDLATLKEFDATLSDKAQRKKLVL